MTAKRLECCSMALANFGSLQALKLANQSPHFLPDEVKICGVKDDEDEDWACVESAR